MILDKVEISDIKTLLCILIFTSDVENVIMYSQLYNIVDDDARGISSISRYSNTPSFKVLCKLYLIISSNEQYQRMMEKMSKTIEIMLNEQ